MRSNVRFCVLSVIAVGYAGCGDSDDNDVGDNSSSLSVVVAESAGAHCANGGVKIAYGTDTSGDGVLQDSEVTTTQYVCKESTTTLITTTDEPAGDNCSYKGTKVSVGNDTDNSGTLDADEVTSTSYVCESDPQAGWYYGNYTISTAADAAALASYKYIQGDLYINLVDATSELTIASLELVTGEVGSWCPSHDFTVTFSTLQRIGDALYFEDYCGGNTHITASFPELVTVADTIYAYQQLDAFTAPKLQRAGGLYFYYNYLTTLSLPSLAELSYQSLTFQQNTDLPQCDIYTILNQVAAHQSVTDLSLSDNGEVCDDDAIMAPFVTVGDDSTHYRRLWIEDSWDDARTTCQAFGSGWDLAFLSSHDEYTALGATGFGGTGAYWLGYSDSDTEGTWVWTQNVSGNTYAPQPGDADFWDTGEPNGGTGENCLDAYFDSDIGTLSTNDANCVSSLSAFCRLLDAP